MMGMDASWKAIIPGSSSVEGGGGTVGVQTKRDHRRRIRDLTADVGEENYCMGRAWGLEGRERKGKERKGKGRQGGGKDWGRIGSRGWSAVWRFDGSQRFQQHTRYCFFCLLETDGSVPYSTLAKKR